MSDPKDSKEMSFEEKLQIVQELTELDSELGEMNRRLSVLQNGKETVIQDADV